MANIPRQRIKRNWKLTESPWELLSIKRGLDWTTAVNDAFLVFFRRHKDSQFVYANTGATPAPEVRVVLKRRKLQERHVNAVYTEPVTI